MPPSYWCLVKGYSKCPNILKKGNVTSKGINFANIAPFELLK